MICRRQKIDRDKALETLIKKKLVFGSKKLNGTFFNANGVHKMKMVKNTIFWKKFLRFLSEN